MNQSSAQHQEPIIKLALPLSMVYVLLQGVSSLPWEHASAVINNVHEQVCDQLNPELEAQPATDKVESAASASIAVAVPVLAVPDSAPPSAE